MKPTVKDEQRKHLCKTSKAAWKRWKDAGHPRSGPLAEEKRCTKKEVRWFITTARALEVRHTIQEKIVCSKEIILVVSKHLVLRPTCSKFIVDGKSFTDTHNILNAFRSFFGSLAQTNLPSTDHHTCLSDMEAESFGSYEQLLNTEVCIEEIEYALNLLKLGESGGQDGLSPEHVGYEGEGLKIWLRKIFNHILKLEDLPQ